MNYVEHPPPPALRRLVQCAWVLRDDAPGDAVQTVYPDGRCELIAHFAAPMRLHRADGGNEIQDAGLFAGQQRGPIRLQALGPLHCIGVRLMPAASDWIAGARLAGYRDRIPALARFDPAFAAAFASAARTFAHAQHVDGLWRLLIERGADYAPDAAIEVAVATIDAHDGDLRIATVVAATGLGLRSLQTRFHARVGMTAKEYARVRRLQAWLKSLDTADTSLAQLAVAHGYADQAHATRDTGRLTGQTPARLLRALREDRDGAEALRLAAAFVRGHAATGAAVDAASMRPA